LRVKVLVGVHRDYITLSFYLDAAKPWDQLPQIAGGEITGLRRKRILSEADRVRSICEARMVADADGNRPIDREVLPEHGVSGADSATHLSASRYLYAELWEEFCVAMCLDNLATSRRKNEGVGACGRIALGGENCKAARSEAPVDGGFRS
jgi:hypothetical protein